MARMIPSVLSPEVKSNAERKIFEWFRDDPETEGWVVLHSLGIANHKTVLYGELDFFVIAPKLGVFALEVKGGRVRCEDGIWYFTNKYNQVNTKTRGPFAQANEGMFSLMDAVKKTYGQHNKLSNLLYGTGVMFPDIVFDVSGTEGEQWQVFDSRNGNSVSAYIRKLAKNTKKKWENKYGFFPESKIPDSKDVKELTKMLRGNFDKVQTIGKQISYAEEALVNLTEEQFRCLDQLEDNPRCLIRGAAGTGKTLLAIEAVKRATVLGEKVALICYNNMLGSWLKKYFSTLPEELQPEYVGTVHSWMLQQVNRDKDSAIVPYGDLDHFYNEELPLLALDSIEKLPPNYDRIIVDETQDIIGTDSFEVLCNSIKGGIERGKWVLFGDFTRQAIYGDVDILEYIEKMDDITSFIRFKLKVNCRNTRQIGDEIKYITGFDSASYLWSKIEGMPVEYKIYLSKDDEKVILENLLKKLLNEGVNAENITILSPYKRENSVVSEISGIKIKDYSPNVQDSIVFSTIQAYKGLENVVVILVDVDTFSHDKLMYVGLSRARSGLFILETPSAENEHINLLVKAVSK